MRDKKLARRILILTVSVILCIQLVAYKQNIVKETPSKSIEKVNIQDLLQAVGKWGYLPEGGLQSGRIQLCYEESGFSPGGDSDLATLALKASIPELVDLLNSSNDPEVLSRVARVLSLINSKAVPMMATPVLEKLLEYKSVDGQGNTRSLEDPRSDISPEQQVRGATAAALKCIMANTTDPQNRGFEVHESTNLPTPPTEAEIETRVSELVSTWEWSSDCLQIDEFDQDESNKEFGLGELSRIGLLGQSAVNPLLKHLGNTSPKVRIAVIRSLGRTGLTRQDDIKLLTARLKDSCIAVRNETIIALGKIGSNAKSAIIALSGELTNQDARIRSNTAEAIGNIGVVTQAPINSLSERLKDEDQRVRVKAAIALLRIQIIDKKTVNLAINELLLGLKDDNPDIRLIVVKDLVDLPKIPQDLATSLITSFTNEQESWELRLNSFFALPQLSNADRAVLQPAIKPFLVEALRKNSIPKYFYSSNVPSEGNWIGDGNSGDFADDEETRKYRQKLFSFYRSWPLDKRHAFFLAGMEPGSFPELNQALREILINKDNDIKARYNSAFILGFVESPNTLSHETINTLKTVMNDTDEDFDIRWMSAFSLIRLKQDVGNFFERYNLPNPMKIDCRTDKFGEGWLLFDPYFGWCEMAGGGGDGSSGWANAIKCFFRGGC